MNSFGNIFKLITFGESHGIGVGGVIDGCPSGIPLSIIKIQNDLNRRSPAHNLKGTTRKEVDKIEILSGLFQGKTIGTPIGFFIRNVDQRPSDYDNLKDIYRPSHADYTYMQKYGIRDHRGGGRSSARETLSRVVGGSIARCVLEKLAPIEFSCYVSQLGDIAMDERYHFYQQSEVEKSLVRCPDLDVSQRMENLIDDLRGTGDTIGGIITCVIRNVPVGLGEPIYEKLQAALGNAMLSINAVKGFEYGTGFDVSKPGSQLNDTFFRENGKIKSLSNHSGGIQGGISNGEDICMRVAFKPISSIKKEQLSIDIYGNPVKFKIEGRHDTTAVIRAVPIVESMATMTILDYLLMYKSRDMKDNKI